MIRAKSLLPGVRPLPLAISAHRDTDSDQKRADRSGQQGIPERGAPKQTSDDERTGQDDGGDAESDAEPC